MADLNQRFQVDERSRAIVEHGAGWLACMAGPGTGKTTALISRIKSLVSKENVGVDTICYLTFIRAIGQAFASDYTTKCGDTLGAEVPRISTLHAFACRLLRNQGFQVQYDGELYFINIAAKVEEDPRAAIFREDLLALVKTADLNTSERLRRALGIIKSSWQTRGDTDKLDDSLPSVCRRALELLRAFRMLDWDYTIPLAHDLLEGMDQPPKWISKLDHYLVDEYQDFNPAEQAFVELLARTSKSIVVVGDDDQSLYRSRGGSPDGIRDLFDPAKRDCVSLVRCYRCRSAIVESANAFLATMRGDPRPMMAKQDGGKISCYSFKSAKAEIAYLQTLLVKAVADIPKDPEPKDGIVCLFSSRKALGFYYDRLKDSVACARREPTINPKREWLARTLDLARRSGQPFLQRLLLDGYSTIKPAMKKAVIQVMLDRGLSTASAVNALLTEGKVSKGARADAEAFVALCNALEGRDSAAVAAVVGAKLGRIPADIVEVIDDVLAALDEDEDSGDAIRNACDIILPESVEPTPDPRAVQFLTIHGSKGLTRKIVIMPGMEQSILPGESQGEDLCEKQRMFYVALTRATDGVLFTFPRTRAPKGDPLSYDRPGVGQPSSFLSSAQLKPSRHE